ncbi:hypothetical protein NQ317_006497 [Molorchus minor]|uniref:CRAL-TRIO domain-containing protein n=1 Tax=Molorchus minor TaxID=1323400 RepID=A0ABQ9J7L0_9CUCU|nr:hypothetical protein NQ317_006497 [Molorchus minor]
MIEVLEAKAFTNLSGSLTINLENNQVPTIYKHVFENLTEKRGECTPHRTDDAFLLRFLRGRLFVVERAHRLFVNYYQFKENNPEFYDGVNLKNLLRIGEDDIITVPPYRDQTGRRILLYRLGNWDPQKYTIDEIFQATMIILELAILEQRAQILGGVCMFDMGGLSLQQAWYLTPSIAHKVIQIMVTSFPMKIHELHIVNQSKIFDFIYTVFKPFINDKMKERIFFHGTDMESLHQHIDPKHLPERYGGVHPDYNYQDWIEYFERDPQIRWELESLGYRDESSEVNMKNQQK